MYSAIVSDSAVFAQLFGADASRGIGVNESARRGRADIYVREMIYNR